MKSNTLMERLRKKLGIETLWLFILSELASGEKYPYALTSIIKEKYGFDAGKVLPYTVLKRLKNEGYVDSRFNGKKHYYIITERGYKVLEEGLKYIEEVLKKMSKGLKQRATC